MALPALKKIRFWNKCTAITSDLCFKKTVEVQVLGMDRYGRSIGIVTLPGTKVDTTNA